MLTELSIRNFAIIDDLRITFSDKLTILSGETGAGKSIIVNAMNLLLGSRANAKLIRTGSETAELEALFEVSPESDTAKIIDEQGFDPSEGLIVRRIISNTDRHKIYINGRLSTMQALTEIAENLASISGQHEHQGLLKDDLHLHIIDQFAGLVPKRQKVGQLYHQILPLIAKLKKLTSQQHHQFEHLELLNFQKKEIIDASLKPGEDDTLEQELLRLKNAGLILQTIIRSHDLLYGMQGAVVESLVEISKDLQKISEIDPKLVPKVKGLTDAAFQIEDISHELRSYMENIEMDEKRLEQIEARLEMIRKLKRKYGGSIESVVSHLQTIERELSNIENISENIESLKEELDNLNQKIIAEALLLSEERKKAAQKLSQKVESELADLKMSGTRFVVAIFQPATENPPSPYLYIGNSSVSENGLDRAEFMIAPNVGEDLKPLANIASGGELSRVVLALKAILAKNDSVETIVFDEVDAGIGGDVAEMVGKKLLTLSKHHQIICITHLPQIAKFGDHHFRISKQVRDGRTRTTIEPIPENDRVRELARMLGGVEITRATLDHAAEMLKMRKE
ncbi:MAG: DNA repair protein RecN [Desulfobacteraceae bacterium]|nr:DNA repair protein RecN [Desulfobacteraceae bacterium]